MRIVYFAHSVLNRGGDKMVLAHLAHLAASGHDVVIRSNVVSTRFPLHPAIKVESPSWGGKSGTLLSAALERQEADCVIASIAPTAALLCLRNRARVLHFAQDDNETAYRALPLRLAMRLLYRFIFSVCALPTVAVSPALAQSFRERFSANCAVVENGVDTSAFFPSPSRELLAAKEGRKAVLVLARRDRRKGFDLALQALLRLQGANAGPVEVWTVGEKTGLAGWRGIHRHFGSVDEESLRGLFSSADAFLYPSRSEGFGLMALEAFACRCPVVCSDAVPYARDGENALVAPVGDGDSLAGKLQRILHDAALAAELSERAFRYAGEHTLAEATRAFEEQARAAAASRGMT